MKIKSDFVTNSSSTSFIVSAPKKGDKIDVFLRVKFDLNTLVSDTIKSKEDIISRWDEEFLESEEGKKMLEELEKGNILLEVTCSDDYDNPLEAYLCNNGLDEVEFPEGYKLIYGSGGY